MTESRSSGPRENRIQSLRTAFDVVDELESRGGAGVSELAESMDLPKSTTHVYLQTLRDAGYVVQEGTEYRLGLRFLAHGGRIRQEMDIYQVARPVVDELSRETGEVGTLGVEEGGKRVLLYSSESPDGVFDNSPTGQFTHMHWTALGKAMLADLSDERVHEIVDEHGLPEATGRTVTDREALLDELETVRERGYSVEDEERREGIKAIGVPIRTAETDGDVAAVSISGPKSRIDRDFEEPNLVDTIQSSVNVIELRFQHY
ncbi:IclR family transcriptional regulator [Halovivax sp.]|uniref:IclR family transcriptional regulator n=1 Tax=Halovivax sp. TaxID=1935978 RepID=UPI0025BEECC8|nr:IclR family transcriptional regulator [Halovivax sp.]